MGTGTVEFLQFRGFSYLLGGFPPATMTRLLLPFQPMLTGLVLTLAQILVAVCLLAPEGPFSYRYSTLIQHDGYWFMNIVNRGYPTTVPPINNKAMEVSNVAFFPAYPVLATLLRRALS